MIRVGLPEFGQILNKANAGHCIVDIGRKVKYFSLSLQGTESKLEDVHVMKQCFLRLKPEMFKCSHAQLSSLHEA